MTDRAISKQIRRAVNSFNAGRHDEARQLCEKAIREKPGDPALNHLLAAILFEEGDIAAARSRVEASLAAWPGNAPARLLAERIARAADNVDAALVHTRRAVTPAPGAEVLLEQARGLDATGLRDPAREAWQKVLQGDPGCREAAARIGRLLWEDGSFAEAASMLARAADGAGPASVWFDLGLVRQDLNDLAGAAVAYRKALEKRPDHAEAAVNLGVVLQDGGDVDAAMKAYGAAYRLRGSTFGMIANALTSAPHGRLWLDRESLNDHSPVERGRLIRNCLR